MVDEPTSFELPIVWGGGEDLPVIFANQFLLQVHQGEVFLTVGTTLPPVLIGTPDQVRKTLEATPYVRVLATGRYALTRRKLEELISVLGQGIEMLDREEGR
jgi:hypothetical protein